MKKKLSLDDYFLGIKNRDISILAKSISLVESKNPEHQKLSIKLIRKILPHTGQALRIAISGTPGVGKSTFLENFGMHLINQGKKIAVLAIDPTSQITGGSILGDKTRMFHLSSHQNAFVRPSPNGETLGGIAAKTREAMLLCDAFGFDYIFIETVGVGQSELSVSHIVDMFILLMQPGSGDELQGIKRGILEISDLVIVNKADGDSLGSAQVAAHDFQKSLSILQGSREWQTSVLKCSSLNKIGFDDVQLMINKFFEQYDLKQRDKQVGKWIKDLLIEKFTSKILDIKNFEMEVEKVSSSQSDIIGTVDSLYEEIIKND